MTQSTPEYTIITTELYIISPDSQKSDKMTGAVIFASDFAGTLNTHIYNAITSKSATELILLLLQGGT